jgi:hypothetical protein
MDNAVALVEPKDGEVHVFKETKPYEECLLSVAQVLENRSQRYFASPIFECSLDL